MHIEITKETFVLIFNESQIIKTENKETYIKTFYYNKETKQQGFKIFNFVSSVYGSFYLTDINA